MLLITTNNLENCVCHNALTVQKIVDVFWARPNAEVNVKSKVLKIQPQSLNIIDVHHETSVEKKSLN